MEQDLGGTVEKRAVIPVDMHDDVADQLPDRTFLVLIEVTDRAPAEPLQEIAAALNRALRPNDVVFRRGLRQVALLCSGLEEAAVTRMVARAISSMPEVKSALAMSPKDGQSLDQLLATADHLLRQQTGRPEPERRSIH